MSKEQTPLRHLNGKGAAYIITKTKKDTVILHVGDERTRALEDIVRSVVNARAGTIEAGWTQAVKEQCIVIVRAHIGDWAISVTEDIHPSKAYLYCSIRLHRERSSTPYPTPEQARDAWENILEQLDQLSWLTRQS